MGEVTRGARALVVCPDIGGGYDLDAQSACRSGRLALAIGVVIAESFVLPVREVKPNLLFGAARSRTSVSPANSTTRNSW